MITDHFSRAAARPRVRPIDLITIHQHAVLRRACHGQSGKLRVNSVSRF